MTSKQSSQAFTLTEILVVCLIIAVLAAILIPVTLNTRRKSLQTTCISNLRQVGQAMHMYVQDNEGPPPRLHTLYPQYISDKRVFLCPLDRWKDTGGYAWQAGGKYNTPPETWLIPVSYLYLDFLYPKNQTELDKMSKVGYRPGYAMCLLHAEKEISIGPYAPPIYNGLSLRLCLDSSVIERQVKGLKDQSGDGSIRGNDWEDMLKQ